jgi:RHS repeat-associated protein
VPSTASLSMVDLDRTAARARSIISLSSGFKTLSLALIFHQACISPQRSAGQVVLSCSPIDVVQGSTATCTADLLPGTPGYISFAVDGAAWQSQPLSNSGIATATGVLAGAEPGHHLVGASLSESVLHLRGTRDGGDPNAGMEGAIIGVPAGIVGTTIQAGDELIVDEEQNIQTFGGLTLFTNDGSTCLCSLIDETNQMPLFANSYNDGSWHHFAADLSPYAGEVISFVRAGFHNAMSSTGIFDLQLANAYLVHSNGEMLPILNGQQASVTNFWPGAFGGAVNVSSGTEITPVAQAFALQNVLHIRGTRDGAESEAGVEGAIDGVPENVSGTVLNAGDTLVADEKQNIPTYGGVALFVTGNSGQLSCICTAADETSQVQVFGNSFPDTKWHHFQADLTPWAGQTIAFVRAGIHNSMAPTGTFDLQLANIYVVHSDGTTMPIYNGQPAQVENFISGYSGGATNVSSGTVPTAVAELSGPSSPAILSVLAQTPAATITCSPATVNQGGTTDCSVQLNTGATGAVTFSVQGGGNTSASPDASGLVTTFVNIPATQSGSVSISFSYPGDTNNQPQSGSTTVVVRTTATASADYHFNITSYDGTGNVQGYTDSVNGQWSSIIYDSLSRLAGATGPAEIFCWSYDSFGNRLQQSASSQPFNAGQSGDSCESRATGTLLANSWAQYNANNQMSANPQSPAPNSLTTQSNPSLLPPLDAAGNVQFDGSQSYLYDGEGRLCAVQNVADGLTGYLYNAEGVRVAKGSLTSFSCDLTLNGFTVVSEYIQDAQGNQMTEIEQGVWAHTNVFADGQLIATYSNDGQGVHFQLSDWLGTRRMQTDYAGNPELTCQSLPFGDSQMCAPVVSGVSDTTEHHFTGKERDTASGLDYFGARYYGSSMGRFSSPDPSGLMYADQENPQSFNLYAYALNNPLKNTDPTGLYCYYGSTDADVGDDSQYDFHSSVGECTQTDENGNQGQWVDDPHTEVNVSANGDGSIDSYSSSFDGTTVIPYEQYSQWQGDPDDKRIQTLSQDITTDVQYQTGCIAQAYGIAGAGNTVAGAVGRPSVVKPHAGWGLSQGTSRLSKGLSDFAKARGWKANFPSPTGGLLSDGQPFVLGSTRNLGRAVGRWAPWAVSAITTTVASVQLWNCLGK